MKIDSKSGTYSNGHKICQRTSSSLQNILCYVCGAVLKSYRIILLGGVWGEHTSKIFLLSFHLKGWHIAVSSCFWYLFCRKCANYYISIQKCLHCFLKTYYTVMKNLKSYKDSKCFSTLQQSTQWNCYFL